MRHGFKYRSNFIKEDGLYRDMETLIRDELYAPHFKDLNDPFEAISAGIFADAMNMLIGVIDGDTQRLNELTQSIVGFRDRAGVYSLAQSDSGIPDNELMWAHYANSHKGFCIEYDIEQLQLSEELWFNVCKIDQIIYSEKVPEISLADIFAETHRPLIAKMYGTKSMAWSYENETRLLYETSGVKRYNPAALKAVYFGLNMDAAQEQYLIDNLQNRNLKFYKMRMSDSEYKLSAELFAENHKDYQYSLDNGQYEIIMEDHNKTVENFHVHYKGTDVSHDTLLKFIKAFRERHCKRKSNVSLYNVNNEHLKKLINTYPLNGDDLGYMRKHFLAYSPFGLEDSVWRDMYA